MAFSAGFFRAIHRCVGVTEERFYQLAIERYKVPITIEQLRDEGRREVLEVFSAGLKFMDGFEQLHSQLRPTYLLGLVTSTSMAIFEAMDRQLRLRDLFPYVLTGEKASYQAVTPETPFDPRQGHWGALEVVARYSELRVDKAAFPVFADPQNAAGGAKAWALGFNWYLNRNVKIVLNYEQTDFSGNGRGDGREQEKLFLHRFQIAF